jgi:hypothetical protein
MRTDGQTNGEANRRFRHCAKAAENYQNSREDNKLFWTNETASVVQKCILGEKQKGTVLQ